MNVSKHENIDKSRKAGTNPEHTAAWSEWATRHMPEMRLLHAVGILGPENRDWRNVAEHLLVVNATSNLIAESVNRAGLASIDGDVVDKASILHDSTKRLEKERGISYGNEHGSLLRHDALKEAGYSDSVIAASEYTGRVAEMFIEDDDERVRAIEGIPLELLIVAYADARTRNTNVVSLEQARDMNKVKVPKDAEVYDQWYAFYKQVESRLLSFTDENLQNPSDINDESVIALVEQRHVNG